MTKPSGIITVCSGKGGVGKTTSAAAIAGGLAVLGIPPDAVIDLDYGASLTRSYGYDPSSPAAEHFLDGRLSFEDALNETDEGIPLIPTTAHMAQIPLDRMTAWRDRLIELGRNRLIVIDTSDDILSAPVAAAILAADVLAIPVPLEKKAYARTYPEIAGLLSVQQHQPETVWFAVMVDKRPRLAGEMLRIIAEDGVEILEQIPRAVAANEADFANRSVVAQAPKSKVGLAYINLARLIYARLQKKNGSAIARPTGRQPRAVAV